MPDTRQSRVQLISIIIHQRQTNVYLNRRYYLLLLPSTSLFVQLTNPARSQSKMKRPPLGLNDDFQHINKKLHRSDLEFFSNWVVPPYWWKDTSLQTLLNVFFKLQPWCLLSGSLMLMDHHLSQQHEGNQHPVLKGHYYLIYSTSNLLNAYTLIGLYFSV